MLLSYNEYTVDPATLSGRVLDLDSSKGITLVSGKVDIWADQSGLTNNAVAPSGINRPNYINDANGIPVVEFTGDPVHLNILSDLGINSYPFTYLCYIRSDGPTNKAYLSLWNSSSHEPYYLGNRLSTIARNTANPPGALSTNDAIARTNIHEFINDTNRTIIDSTGTYSATGVVTFNSVTDRVIVGALRGPAFPHTVWYSGYLYRIVVFNRLLTANEVEGTINYGKSIYRLS